MADLQMNLDAEIGKLKDRRKDLEDREVDPPGPSANDKAAQRLRIGQWKPQINQKIAALETIKTNKAAAVVTVTSLTAAELAAAQTAMADLNTAVQQGQTWTTIVANVTRVITAADTVVKTAKKA